MFRRDYLDGTNFNPRAPQGARPHQTVLFVPYLPISIHALRKERDSASLVSLGKVAISIHALRKERDYV